MLASQPLMKHLLQMNFFPVAISHPSFIFQPYSFSSFSFWLPFLMSRPHLVQALL
jgi:hypothetical protein